MRINKIEIDGFGKLNHVSLPFSDGFNLIVGDNESGKSTICEFLLAMFYELPNALKKTTKYDDSRKLYRPWNGTAFGGRVYFTDDNGERFVLEKSFGKTKNSDRAKLLYADTWEPAGDATGVGERFFGLSREGFLKTLYVKSMDARGTVGEAEVMAKLSNMETGADEDISYEKIKAAMEKAHGKIKTKTGRGGALAALYDRKNDLESQQALLLRKAEQRKETEAQAARLAAREEELVAQRKALEPLLATAKEHAAFMAEKQATESREVLSARYKTECQRLAEMKFRYEADCTQENPVAQEDVARARELEKAQMLAAGRNEAIRQAAQLAAAQNAENRKARRARRKVGILLAACGVIFGVILFFVSKIAAACAAAAFIATGSIFFLLGKAPAAQESAEPVRDGEEERLQGELDSLFKQYGAKTLSELEEMWRAGNELQKKLPELAEDIRKLESETEKIFGEISKIRIPEPKAYADEAMHYQGEPVSVLEERIRKISAELDDTKETLQNIRLELARESAGEKSVSEVESALFAAVEEIERLEKQEAAFCLAQRWLERAHGEIKENFAPRLNQKTGEIFRAVTDGKYSDVRVGEAFSLRYKNETGEITESASLSRGANDLLYISLRLATLATLFEKGVPTFILDDAFSQMDDVRCEKAVSYIRHAAPFGQVLMFTCHRESAKVFHKEHINLIDLNKEGVLSDEQGLQD